MTKKIAGAVLTAIIRELELSFPPGPPESALSELDRLRRQQSCGIPNKPPCCLSACALIYFGGTQWRATDRLGLHRPSLRDMGAVDLDKAQAAFSTVKEALRRYLDQMDAPAGVFELMMNTPPEKMAVRVIMPEYRYEGPIGIYPASIGDWLRGKCRSKPPTDQDSCMWDEYRAQHQRSREKWLEAAEAEEERRREQERGPPLSPDQKEKLMEAYERLRKEGRIDGPELPPEVLERAKEIKEAKERAAKEIKEAKEMRPPTKLEPPPTLECKTDSDLRAVFPAICP